MAVGERRPVIVVAERYSAGAEARLAACGELVVLDEPTPETLRAAITGADALLVRSYAEVTADVLAAADRLQVIGRGGIGLDNIDLPAARARGITVVYTPQASTRSVAEHALGLMLAVERRIVAGDAAVRDGSFITFRNAARYRELRDCTLGIVGMGRIGSLLGHLAARGLGMRVIYNDIRPVGPFDFEATPADKESLYAQADFVSLHIPLTRLTRGMIDAPALARFRPRGVLINTARGAVLDADAVAAALSNGQLGGAGLDVFAAEPLPTNHPLLSASNVVLTPHVAGRSIGARQAMDDVVDDVVAVLEGRTPQYAAPDDPE